MWYQILFSIFIFLFYAIYKYNIHRKVIFYGKVSIIFFYIYLVFMFKVFPVLLFRENHYRNLWVFSEKLCHLLHLYGLKWQIQNQETLKLANGGILMMNHQSTLDLLVPVFLSLTNNRIIRTTKVEIMRWPFLAWIIRKCQVVIIDRNNPKAAYLVLNDVIETLKKEKALLLYFPEGTRNKERKTKLLPFKRGGFVVAITGQLPIYPVVSSPHYYFYDEAKCILRRNGKVTLRCLPPVQTTGLTLEDVPALQERVYQLMLDAYEDLHEDYIR